MESHNLSRTLDKVSDLIKDESSLSNLEQLIADITKEKYSIDSQLNIEQDRHLTRIQDMITEIHNASKNLQDLKYSVGKLEDLRRENVSNNSNHNFEIFDLAALVLKNIKGVEEVYSNISTFDEKEKVINQLLDEEYAKDEKQELQFSTGDNLLVAHYELNRLRDLQDQMWVMEKNSKSPETKKLVHQLSNKLNVCISRFDGLLTIIIDSILDFVESENFGFLIKVVKIIQYEEREDLKVRLWDSLLEKRDTESIEKSVTNVRRLKERGYKNRFENIMKQTIEDRFSEFLESKDISIFLGEEGTFYYQTLSDYKVAIDRCFPKEWKFFPKVLEWHQESIKSVINKILEDNLSNSQLSEIIELDYENKQSLKKLFKIPNKDWKKFRLLAEDKKKHLLDNSLQDNIKSTTKWIETALTKAVSKFESLDEEPPDRRDGRLSFQVAQEVMLILSSNTKSIRTLGDASVLVQYYGFFANEIMRTYQECWVRSLDKMTELWNLSRSSQNSKNSQSKNKKVQEEQNAIINENIGYLPRYITNLANDCLILTDALERDFDLITEGLNEIHTQKLIDMKQTATNHSIELGTYCLQKLSLLAAQDFGPIMVDIFNKPWYNSPTLIDSVLNIIDEEYIMPFIDYSYPELLMSLFDFITDEFLLKYLSALNYKRKFEKNIVSTLERDGYKIMEVLGKHDDDGSLERKMIVFDLLIELCSADNNNEQDIIEKWTFGLSEIYDLPIDLLRVILECKKVDKSNITFILGECGELCKQSLLENSDQPASIFRKFHYASIGK